MRGVGPLAPGAPRGRPAAPDRGRRRPRPLGARGPGRCRGRGRPAPFGISDAGRGRRRGPASTAGPIGARWSARFLGRLGRRPRPTDADEATAGSSPDFLRSGHGALVAPRPDDRDGPCRRARPREPRPAKSSPAPRPGGRATRPTATQPPPRGVRAADAGPRAVLSRSTPTSMDICLIDPAMPAGVLADALEARAAGDVPRPGPGDRGPGRARPRAASPRSARRSPRAGPTSRAARTTRSTSRSCRSSSILWQFRRGARCTASTSTTGTSRPSPGGGSGSIRSSRRSPSGSGSGSRIHLGLRRRPVPGPPRGEAALGEPRRLEPGVPDPPAAGGRPGRRRA